MRPDDEVIQESPHRQPSENPYTDARFQSNREALAKLERDDVSPPGRIEPVRYSLQ